MSANWERGASFQQCFLFILTGSRSTISLDHLILSYRSINGTNVIDSWYIKSEHCLELMRIKISEYNI